MFKWLHSDDRSTKRGGLANFTYGGLGPFSETGYIFSLEALTLIRLRRSNMYKRQRADRAEMVKKQLVRLPELPSVPSKINVDSVEGLFCEQKIRDQSTGSMQLIGPIE
jgi:hypothetical protein